MKSVKQTPTSEIPSGTLTDLLCAVEFSIATGRPMVEYITEDDTNEMAETAADRRRLRRERKNLLAAIDNLLKLNAAP